MHPSGPAKASPPVPERIGRYEILLPIASGGMATVYLARSRGAGGFEREVALKLTHPHLRETQEFASHLLEEAKLAVRIRHPNVVPVLDVEDDPAGLFLVMDYVHGDTLAGLRKKSHLPPRIGVKILLDGLAGLHAAHELRDEDGQPLQIVHRDFSPQNILVGLDGVSRLTDFGIAKAATRLSNTSTGLVKGKAAYMAPEQAKSQQLDRRCDVWAAGIIAWEILAERRLYDSEDLATLLKVVSETPPRLRSIVPQLPQEVDDVVAKALSMDLERRTPTAAAFSRSLLAAAYPHGLVAEADEVAAYVEDVSGKKLAERRVRAKDIAERRARGERHVVVPEAGGGTPSARRAPVVSAFDPTQVADRPPVAPPPPPSAPRQEAREQMPAPQMVTGVMPPPPVIVPTPSAPHALVPVVPVDEPSEPGHEPTRTDTNAIATHEMDDLLARPRTPPRALVVGAAAVVALLGILLIVTGLRSGRQNATATPTQTSTPTAATEAPRAEPPHTAPTGAAATTPGTTFELPSIDIHANAPIKEVRVDGRPVELPPGREARVDLFPEEHAKSVRISATSTDGRQASATLAAGAKSVTLEFPRAASTPAAPPRPATPATTTRPPPLAGNPYAKP
jgi:serine/threonine-protein kinase